jgi:tetratricopeptide (TPR) repeat protein
MGWWMRFIGLGLLAISALVAQNGMDSRGIPVRGEISSTGPVLSSWTVELRPLGSGIPATTTVAGDGSFEFRSISPGTHQLRIVGTDGQAVYEETVVIQGPGQVLSVRIPAPANANRAAGATVTYQQLSHKVPPQAQKAFDKGEQAAAKGSYELAAESFRAALKLDPEFADAYNELGAAETALNDLPHAAEEFQKAIDLAPDHRLALPNLAIVLAKMQKYHEAGEVARRALKIVPGACDVHYILAASILMEQGYTDEVLDHLLRAAPQVHKAHLIASDLLAQRGRRDEAIQHLEEYLRVVPANDAYRTKAEARLAQLKQ